MEKELVALNGLITDLLGTGLAKNLVSQVARARVFGEPVDLDRMQLFESLYEELVQRSIPIILTKTGAFNHFKILHFLKDTFRITLRVRSLL